jgi:hypothetical protein
MKTIFGIIILILFSTSCKRKSGEMKYKVKYSTAKEISGKRGDTDSFHSGFGTFITSITPSHFSCKMSMLMFQDHLGDDAHMISFVDGHDNQPGYEIASYADFSGNKEVEINPILYSRDMRDGVFEQKQVDFRFLTFSPIYFLHEFEIPIQYLNLIKSSNTNHFLNGSEFSYDSVQNKIKVTAQRDFSYGAIHGSANAMPTSFNLVFGNTDSSYIYMYNGINLPEEKRFPFWDRTGSVMIRSHKYSIIPIVMPDKGEVNTMYSTIAFYTNGLIHVYSGNDKTPYTADDVFVYAPRFWDRINVNLSMINN